MTKIANFQYQFSGPTFGTVGNIDTSVQIAYAGDTHSQKFTVAASGTQELFDIADDLGNFDFLIIVPEGPSVLLQVVIDDGANNGESYQVYKLRQDVPFILPLDDGLASDGTVDNFSGTADLIERVTCKNTHTDTVDVRVVAVT